MTDRELPKEAAKYFDKVRLIAFLKKYEAEKLGQVDKILELYSGNSFCSFFLASLGSLQSVMVDMFFG